MGKAAFALLLLAGGCSNNDNVVYGAIGASSITPFISFENVSSVISGVTGTSEVVIFSNRPALCDRLLQNPDYFRNPHETYVALILFLPGDNRLGTFLPGRPGDEGTGSEIIGADPSLAQASMERTGKPVAPFPAENAGYIAVRDWSEAAGGESVGTFSLLYDPPPPLTSSGAFPFSGNFKSKVCTTLDGTQLP